MRVLLFVQTGDARPVCVKSFGWIAYDGGPSTRAVRYLGAIRFGTHLQPDRGWLVACLSAEAGRRVIADVESGKRIEARVEGFHRGPASYEGRILASGGKR